MQVLRDMNWDCKRGERVGLVGRALHSSTSQLNLSRLRCSEYPLNTQ